VNEQRFGNIGLNPRDIKDVVWIIDGPAIDSLISGNGVHHHPNKVSTRVARIDGQFQQLIGIEI